MPLLLPLLYLATPAGAARASPTLLRKPPRPFATCLIPFPMTDSARPAAPKDRMARLTEVPRLRKEAETIRVMTGEYCAHFHGTDGRTLCPSCAAFLAYALKRLACCPYGGEKPVCGKCRIHCYKPAERETARRIMRWAGPRLILKHPVMAIEHVLDARREAPEKPRNTRTKATPKPAPQAVPKAAPEPAAPNPAAPEAPKKKTD